MPDLPLLTDDLLLTSVYGGILFGLGTGIILTARSTSGGTDLLSKAIHSKLRFISMGRLIQILDGAVVIVGAVTFSVEHTLFAIISVYISGKLTDVIVDAGKRAKMCLIISEQNEEIAQTIMKELDRGVTGLKGKGMYTGNSKVILLCICSKHDIPDIKDIVRSYDKRAFFIINNVSEAMGEGFVEHWK